MESFEREIRRLEYYHTNRPLVVGYWSWGLGPQYFCLRCGRKEFSPPRLPGGVNFFREQNWWLLNLPSIIVPILDFFFLSPLLPTFFSSSKTFLRWKKKLEKETVFPPRTQKPSKLTWCHIPKRRMICLKFNFFLIKTKPSRKKNFFFSSMIGDNRGWSPMVRVKSLSLLASGKLVPRFSLYKLHFLVVKGLCLLIY